MMGAVQSKLARFLGPKGLMPVAKRGGVGEGDELAQRIKEAGGLMEWKADKLGVVRAREWSGFKRRLSVTVLTKTSRLQPLPGCVEYTCNLGEDRPLISCRCPSPLPTSTQMFAPSSTPSGRAPSQPRLPLPRRPTRASVHVSVYSRGFGPLLNDLASGIIAARLETTNGPSIELNDVL
jgi:hypothetical protein